MTVLLVAQRYQREAQAAALDENSLPPPASLGSISKQVLLHEVLSFLSEKQACRITGSVQRSSTMAMKRNKYTNNHTPYNAPYSRYSYYRTTKEVNRAVAEDPVSTFPLETCITASVALDRRILGRDHNDKT